MQGRTVGVATLNLEDGKQYEMLPDLLRELDEEIDIFCLQEAKGWNFRGQNDLFGAEALLAPFGLNRSYLTRNTRGLLHQVVFVRNEVVRPVHHFTPDLPDINLDECGKLEFFIAGFGPPVTVFSVQWPYEAGAARTALAHKLTRYADPSVAAIIAGDLNGLWPDCYNHPPEYEPNWYKLPLHKRTHKTLGPGQRAEGEGLRSDRLAATVLSDVGFVSAGCVAGDMTVTVNADRDSGEGARIDHIVLSPALANAVVRDTYKVHQSPTGDAATDHRLVYVRLDLGRAMVAESRVIR